MSTGELQESSESSESKSNEEHCVPAMTSECKSTGELQELTQDKQVMPKENYRNEELSMKLPSTPEQGMNVALHSRFHL